jgi:hypothetical protein
MACPEGLFCRAPQEAGLPKSIDKPQEQELIDYGITGFDNLGIGILTIFQMITLEGWTKIMYNLMDSDLVWMAVIFSVLLILIGSFFLLNVILAVLSEALDNADQTATEYEDSLNKKITNSVKRSIKQGHEQWKNFIVDNKLRDSFGR